MSDKMYGVVEGLYYTNLERTEELSKRMYNRNIPSSTLQPQFSMRAVATKYDLMPVLDRHAPSSVPIKTEPTYNIGKVFNPGTAQAPWSGFAANVNNESQLRNQFFALQKSAQATYIPPSTSDMYQNEVYGGSIQQQQPFPYLFTAPDLDAFNPNTYGIASNTFSNHTRQQLKTL